MLKDTDTTTPNLVDSQTRATAATEWLTQGYLPIPVLPGQKATRVKHMEWLSSLSEQSVDVHWSMNVTDEIALHCSKGLVVLDADSPESLAAIVALEAKHGLSPKMVVSTKKGVHHYFRQSPELQIKAAGHSTDKHPERIDVRCGNGYIIAPPSTDKSLVTEAIVRFEDLTILTQEFVDDLNKHNGVVAAAKLTAVSGVLDGDEFGRPIDTSVKVARLKAMLEHIDPEDGYSSWLNTLMVIHHETDGSDEGLALADEWSSKGSSYEGLNAIERKWSSFSKEKGTPVTMASIASRLKEQGLDWMGICAEGEAPFEVCEMKVVAPSEWSSYVPAQPSKDIVQALDRKTFPNPPSRKNGVLVGTFHNFEHIMKGYGIEMAYDKVRKDVLIKVPHLVTTIDNAKEVTKAHIKSLCALNGFPNSCVDSNVLALADLNAFNPVADWISSIPWDGVDRLPQFRSTLVTDAEYPQAFKDVLLDKWMTSAVAAAFTEDFRSRGVLTLAGPQGIGKTSWVNALVSSSTLRKQVVLTGHSLDANSRDSKSTAITKWITELGEVETTLKNDLPAVKAFITNDMDVFRRPYAHEDSTMARRTVFCASVNDKWYLKDPTGNSRFWSINVVKINFDHGLDMQQVFAQYKAEYFDKCQTWWLDADQEAQLTELNKEFEPVSPVKEALALLLQRGKKCGYDTAFMTATQLIKAIGIRATTKEVHVAMKDLQGPPRKTKGNLGWDVQVVIDMDL